MVSSNDIARQIQIESEGISEGIQRYRQKRIDAIHRKGDMSQLDPEFRLMMQTVEPIAKGIIANLGAAGSGKLKVKRYGTVRKILREVPPMELAYLTVRHLVNVHDFQPLQYTAIQLGKSIENHLDYLKFKEEAPKYLKAVEGNLKTSNLRHRKRVLTYARHRLEIEDVALSEDEQFQIGRCLIDIALPSTPSPYWTIEAFKREDENSKHTGKPFYCLRPTKMLKTFIKEVDVRCEMLSPLYMPTVIPPVEWSDYYGGGYYSETRQMKPGILRSRKRITRDVFRKGDNKRVFDALNAIQNTAWQINTDILEVMKECAKTGMAKLPVPDVKLVSIPRPWANDEEFERWKAERPIEVASWKCKQKNIMDKWHRDVSNRASLGFKLMLAERFKDEETLYFPHSLDWRGRVYPMASFLNPQSDDPGKALLKFAEGKPLGERGAYWLAVHLANTWGEDKVSFEDRVMWCHKNTPYILASASNPLDYRWWMDADKPFCFLAATFEFAKYHVEGPSFVSHLPIAMDGSCSGLQHFSGLLRDPVGGKSVNLVPSDVPSDVYADVAKVASGIIASDMNDVAIWKGIKSNEDITVQELAELWHGKVDRSVTKSNVMTTPYGATARGFEEQIQKRVIQKKSKPGQPFIDGDVYLAAKYLADVNARAIDQVVIKAREAMDWIQEMAKIVSAAGEVIQWTTPVGLRVVQDYRKTKTKRMKTIFGDVIVKFGLREDIPEKTDTTAMSNGLSPNFIHSMDAAHLMLTILRCGASGLRSFGLIHDSFAVHACDTDLLHQSIRDTFVEMYQGNRLMDFYEEVCASIDPEVAEKIPTPPQQGSLDLNCVRSSRFFFA